MPLLVILSLPYGLVTRARNFLYDLKLLPVRPLALPSVCVGNLTVGGTGKTPTVAWIAARYAARGCTVAVLRRGYRRGKGEGPSDETAELMKQLPAGVTVIENPDRVSGARTAAESGAEVLVLDDGFQHRRAARNLDVVLVDAVDPFGGGHLLPWGLLRESVQGLTRAGVVMVTRSDAVDGDTLARLEAELARLHPDAPIVRAVHAPRRLTDAATGESIGLRRLLGQPVRALAGLARPEAFFRTLEDIGAHVEERRSFPDHHDYTAGEVKALLARPGPRWVTTEKDWAKIGKLVDAPSDLWVLGIEMEIHAGKEALEHALDAVLAGAAGSG